MNLPKFAAVLGVAIVTARVAAMAQAPAPVAAEKSAVPRVPAISPEELAQQQAYPLTASGFYLTQQEDQACPHVQMSLRVEDTAKDPNLIAITGFVPTTVLTDSGVPIVLAQGPGLLEPFRDVKAAPDGSWPQMRLSVVALAFDLPPDVKELTYIDGTAMLVRAGPRVTVSWDDPAKHLHETQSAGGCSFVLTNCAVRGDRVEIEFDGTTADGELIPVPSMRTIETTLYFTDHTTASPSGGGGLGKHMEARFGNWGNKTPASFQISLNPPSSSTQTRQRLTLRHVVLPFNAAPADPPGPRGPHQVTVDGYSFSLQNLMAATQVAGKERFDSLQMGLRVKGPSAVTGMNAKSALKPITAVDVAGNTLQMPDGMTAGGGLYLKLPDPKTDRLVLLKGTYCVPTITDRREVTFPMPDDEVADGNLLEGSVTLRTVHRDAAGLHLEWDLAMGGMPAPTRARDGNHGDGDPPYITTDLYDADGKALAWTGKWDAREGAYCCSGLLKPGPKPVKFVVRYATQVGVKVIPFEFKDIGIPRAAGNGSARVAPAP